MKVVNINQGDPELLESIIEKLRNAKSFVAISFNENGASRDHWYLATDEQVVFQLEMLKNKILKERAAYE